MYGTKAGIERLIGDIVPGRKFGHSTTPSQTQVEAELDNTAAEINNALEVMHYVVPVSNSVNPYAHAFLKAANEYGAAARLLATIPTEAYDPGEQMEDTGQTRPQMYDRHFKHALKVVWEKKLSAARTESRYPIRANSVDPLYKRGMMNITDQDEDE